MIGLILARDLLQMDRQAYFESEQIGGVVHDDDARRCLAEYDTAIAAVEQALGADAPASEATYEVAP